jgi:hypothetical protein
MAIEIIGISAAFQSEKTGSTPVGSAKNAGQLIDKYQLFGSGDDHWSRNPESIEDILGGNLLILRLRWTP